MSIYNSRCGKSREVRVILLFLSSFSPEQTSMILGWLMYIILSQINISSILSCECISKDQYVIDFF